MEIRINTEIKDVYLKLILVEVILWVMSFVGMFIFNNYVFPTEVLGENGCYWGFLPSTILWLVINVVIIAVYAGVKNLKYIFLQIVTSFITYLLFLHFLYSYLIQLEGKYTVGSIAFLFRASMKKEFLLSFIFAIFSLSILSLLTRVIFIVWKEIRK